MRSPPMNRATLASALMRLMALGAIGTGLATLLQDPTPDAAPSWHMPASTVLFLATCWLAQGAALWEGARVIHHARVWRVLRWLVLGVWLGALARLSFALRYEHAPWWELVAIGVELTSTSTLLWARSTAPFSEAP